MITTFKCLMLPRNNTQNLNYSNTHLKLRKLLYKNFLCKGRGLKSFTDAC